MKIKSIINVEVIGRNLGVLLFIESFFMLTAVPFSFYYHSPHPESMAFSSLITFLGGFILYGTCHKNHEHAVYRDRFIIVTLSWIMFSLFGSLPYLLSHSVNSVVDAFFESMSGFTTTGASVIVDKEVVPKDILYWRSLTQWLGGLGIIVFTVLILPLLGLGGHISSIQGNSFEDSAKIHPHFTATIKWLGGIYFILTVIEFIMLSFGNLGVFDSLCCSLTTLSSGGFSTKNDSAASMNTYTQCVVMLFMVLSGTNFVLVYMLLKGHLKLLIKNEEFRTYVNIFVIVGVIAAFVIHFMQNTPWDEALLNTLFSSISLISTTGYSTVNYLNFPTFVWVMMLMLVLVGGCVGSTAGGIKVLRHTLLFKNSFKELKRTLHPNAVLPPRFNGKSVPHNVINRVSIFVIIFMVILISGVAFFSIVGIDFNTSIGLVLANLCNVGVGIGDVGPLCTYDHFSSIVKVACSVLQLLGRLDILTVIALLTKNFWTY